MNPMPVLTLLGVSTLLPCVPALICQRGRIQTVRNESELPLEWGTGEKACEVGEGCQDVVMLLHNGPLINLVIIKGCIKAEDQEPRVTWLSTGPGLSVVSYTHVCRHGDLCNNASSTRILEDLSTPTVPGSLRCPLCLSNNDCENAPEQVCPVGSIYCYNGVLRLRGEGIRTNLKVQGCMAQPGCNLLNGTTAVGTLDMSENCGLQLGPQALDCNSASLDIVKDVSDLHLSWTTGWKTCEADEGCYETVMLIQNGQEIHMALTKGCTSSVNREAQLTRHRTGPGISIVSYVHVCRNGDFCNDLSSTETLWIPPPDTVPGTLRCPHCLSTRDCENAPEQVCPEGTHCYNGVLRLRGGAIATNLRVQGCTSQPGCGLLNGTKTIGPIGVREDCGPQSGAQALECRSGWAEGLRKVSSLPLDWTTAWETCKIGEGCQETALLIQNGPLVNLVLIKGCTAEEDHKPQITRHRLSPSLSIVSYSHVCRHWDFCNDLSSTHPLWLPPPPVEGLGNVSCPFCLSKDGCPQNGPKQVCPVDSSHCYSGVLSLRGGGFISDLKVQGCTSQSQSQSDCNLLNGIQTIGPIKLHESCGFHLAAESLKCQHGTLEAVQHISKLPLQWTAEQKTCNVGEGCQDTLVIIENGEHVNLVLTKGCTAAEDHKAKVTEHRTGPGLAVISYTRVCREKDLCNDLSTTVPLWAPPPVTAPGNTRCPLCFTAQACENAPEQFCPAGSTHCYSGVLSLRGGEIISKLKVQGCMSQPGCNLLNGTQKIGPVDVSEDCSPRSNSLTCHRGTMLKIGNGFAEKAVEWTPLSSQVCEPDEICQETLLLIDVGQKSALLGSKGCSSLGAQNDVGVSIFSRPPGMVVASYTRFCSSNLCNAASSTSVLLSNLPRPEVLPPGSVKCPVCVQLFRSCFQTSDFVTCPRGATHCYRGDIALRGGGLSSTLSIQGCMASPVKSLLGNSKTIGILSAKESSENERGDEDDEKPLLDGASASSPASMLGLLVLLSSLCAGICPLH
ncbi:CD177 antigen isoform 2 precursor [Rattus norvegicus]|uniref:CD177 antigen isoform 2 precursor n=1 Tax=Rattus norvegicus TaxID=10116 RepID=UPI0003D09EA5|nr:CD177 antigen isoform 2 precursor [Rattus norvegicus]|eukprot:XP_006228609.1 PREDICTED: CD177 antigen isoform X1 [Rattus norvegicus]